MTVALRGERTGDYAFELPAELIAQHPLERRDDSRLMIVRREGGAIEHARFADLGTVIPAGDTIVLNTSRVIRARLLGTREGGGKAEVLLLEPLAAGRWAAMVRPGNRLPTGSTVRLGAETRILIGARVTEPGAADGARTIEFESPLTIDSILDAYGRIPLPPYIERPDTDADAHRYQTVYARESGSVAAPTAGLHFTDTLLATLEARGVRRADLTLHVGPGTFRPVEVDDPALHRMHRERFTLPSEAAAVLNATRAADGKIWAVGTTSLRVLETVVDSAGRFCAADGSTDIFIRPPHRVRGADRIVTNFHLPRSTLLMLVAAFAGYDLMRHSYDVAIREGYRFYSYGDAMCIL